MENYKKELRKNEFYLIGATFIMLISFFLAGLLIGIYIAKTNFFN